MIHDFYENAALIKRHEIVRLSPTTAEFHRYDSNLTLVETRLATSDEYAEFAEREKRERIDILGTDFTNGVKTLRQWSTQAQGMTVTNQNAVATLQTVVDRLGVFFDRFADLLVLMDQVDIDDFD